MKIIAFAASNSSNSINKKLATYAASLFQGETIEILDLNDYEMPLFSSDRVAKNGILSRTQWFLFSCLQEYFRLYFPPSKPESIW